MPARQYFSHSFPFVISWGMRGRFMKGYPQNGHGTPRRPLPPSIRVFLAIMLAIPIQAFIAQIPGAWAAPITPTPAPIGSATTATSPSPVAPDTASPTSEIHAQLKSRRETVLSSELDARIREIPIRDGERFAKRQVLVRLDCALQQARLAKMNAVLAGAEKVAKIQNRLLELNSTGTLEAALARIDVDKARADIRVQSIMLSKCTVSAPFTGRVVETKARGHQFVRTGQALVEILDDSSLDIDFIAPSRWLAWLKAGQEFSILINETKRSYPGKVVRLGAKVDPVSQLVKVMGAISGRFPELMPGMSGRIIITPPEDGGR
uniref:RND family efflux transporter, MFP subunit n=1 Tax=Candidatus Kentrum sp. LFY TaxID=2126342 RepID=A0A450V2K1_9GAMM|nr:MAG: RND family efflux transporter, MFP subunit [Candidatus Kentron sp. LFY]